MPIRIERNNPDGLTLHLGYRTDVRLTDDEARILLAALSRELSPVPPKAVTPAKARIVRH